mmetsp:Transcript_10286/g.38211  ORF Transcript_10286/g.38211 Transcript_10286/m.38211 type:complete len:300 (+) Transcript_10286:1643-2542(+)
MNTTQFLASRNKVHNEKRLHRRGGGKRVVPETAGAGAGAALRSIRENAHFSSRFSPPKETHHSRPFKRNATTKTNSRHSVTQWGKQVGREKPITAFNPHSFSSATMPDSTQRCDNLLPNIGASSSARDPSSKNDTQALHVSPPAGNKTRKAKASHALFPHAPTIDFGRSTGRDVTHAWMATRVKSNLSYDIQYPRERIKGTPLIGKQASREQMKASFAFGEKKITDLFYSPSYSLFYKRDPSAHIFFGETGRYSQMDSGASSTCKITDILISRINRDLKREARRRRKETMGYERGDQTR